jgi:hypothetical protein
MRNLILSGGIYHPFAETSACVADHLGALGIRSDVESVADGFERLGRESFDLVTVNALAWSMTQAGKYQPFRARYAFDPSPQDREALCAHAERGGGILGLHTAAICFDTWPQWASLLPAHWVWGQSHHPVPGYMSVEGCGEAFTVWDELYCDLVVPPDAQILARAHSPEVETPQPVLIARGRSVYLALGHDLTAVLNTGFQALLAQAASIATGKGKA